MSLPRYQVSVYDEVSGDRLGLFSLVEGYSLRYEIRLNDVGVMALTLPYTLANWQLFTKDRFIDIMRERPDGSLVVEATYFARSRERFADEQRERMVVGGLHVNHLLERRFIDPEDDSVQPNGGYATKAGEAGGVIRAYIREQAGDLASSARGFPKFTVPIETDVGTGVGANLRYFNLLLEMQKLANIGGVDFEITHTGGGNLLCTVGVLGTDRTVTTNRVPPFTILTPKRGNLADPKLVIDSSDEKTFFYALGDGARADRLIVKYTTLRVGDTPYNRIEQKVDARVNNKKNAAFQMLMAAVKVANDSVEERKLKVDFLSDAPGLRYREDWFFGDKVTVQWGDFDEDMRISVLTFTLTSTGEELEVEIKNGS